MTFFPFLDRLLMALGDIFWPPMCATCPRLLPLVDSLQSPEAHFCPHCLQNMEFMPQSSCPLCGNPYYHLPTPGPSLTHSNHICGTCLKSPPPFHSVRSALIYQETVAQAIADLKYRGHLSQVLALASLVRGRLTLPLSSETDPLNPMPDVIVPIPLSRSRLARRGFNQATELAKVVYGPWAALINENLLSRMKGKSLPQATLTRKERQKSIIGSFKVPNPTAVQGLNILLFDDVLTTGATATEAARTLLAAGAARVDLATIARTVLSRG